MHCYKGNNVVNDKCTDLKLYWSVLNNFLNNIPNSIKTSSVSPISMSGKAITDILKKANTPNDFFASWWTPLENNSQLSSLLRNTDKRLSTVSIK